MGGASWFSASASFPTLCVPAGAAALCCLYVLWAARSKPDRKSKEKKHRGRKPCGCLCSCGGDCETMGSLSSDHPNREAVGSEKGSRGAAAAGSSAERQAGGSMMEQLVPEITTHALSYLDYPSLCRLSMTNSSMRRAANDDSAWKALYHKDFTMEQNNMTPPNGWKAYYAATKAVVNVNAEFYNIVREHSLPAMARLWLDADYVKCIHGSGERFTGYAAVMDSWALAFNWVQGGQGVAFDIRDVRVRVSSDMAWVTMKAYVDVDSGPFHITNIYEFHGATWYMVHHHSSVMLIDGEVGQHNVFG